MAPRSRLCVCGQGPAENGLPPGLCPGALGLPTGSHVRHSALALGPQAAATEDLLTCLTLAVSTLLIATVAAAIGTALPKLLNQFRSDPGQAAAMIQARKGSQRDLPKALRGSERL